MAGNWKGAGSVTNSASPSADPKSGSATGGSDNWKGTGGDDARPKSSCDAPVPGRINLPKSKATEG